MGEYNFTILLRLSSPDEDGEQHLETLLTNGCDDATIAFGRRGYLHLDFGREARSAAEAIASAVSDAERAVPGSAVVSLGPDLVNLTDLAEIVGCSRQNMRRYSAGEARTVEAFPPPAANGEPALWHLVEVLPWLERNTPLRPLDPLLHEVAEVTFEENHRLQEVRAARAAGRGQHEAIVRLLTIRFGSRLHTFRAPLNVRKIAEAVARLAGAGTVKTKLNKLMFYADFCHFRTYGASITGLSYVRLPLGPVPDDYRYIFSALEEVGVIASSEEIRGGYVGEVIKQYEVGIDGHLSAEELATIEVVRNRFEGVDANTIVEISHREPAWLDTNPGGSIDYRLAERIIAIA